MNKRRSTQEEFEFLRAVRRRAIDTDDLPSQIAKSTTGANTVIVENLTGIPSLSQDGHMHKAHL